MKVIDLRSDTVTRPTAPMRQRMANAEVGDDMMGEDPTVNRLEQMTAELLGTEAAVFTCSCTQANQIAVRIHCAPGDELLINETGHIANFEAGGPAALSGVTVRTIAAEHGKLDLEHLQGHIRADDQHYGRTRLVCLENTTNLGGGRAYSIAHLQRVADWTITNGLKLHLDGARLFNATIAGGYTAAEAAACVNTISVCFSKGLGCPMGSILAGSADDMARARRVRKLFGGALRQAGIVAAAAVYALENHVTRLAEDHANAQSLAEQLSQIENVTPEDSRVETNIVYFRVAESAGTAVQLAAALRDRGVLILPMGGQRMRAVTHLDVTADEIDMAAAAVRDCLNSGIANRPKIGSGPYDR